MTDQTPKRPYWESFEELWLSQNKEHFEKLKKVDPRRLIKTARSQEELFVIYKNFLRPLGGEQSFYNLYRSRSLELGLQPSFVGTSPSGQGQFVAPIAPQIFEKYPGRKGLQAFAVGRNLYPGIVDYAAISGQKPLFQRSTTGGLANWEAIPQPVKPISSYGKGTILDIETTGLLGEEAQVISAGIKQEGQPAQGLYAAFKHDKKFNPQVEKVISLWQQAVKGKKIGEEKELLTSIIEQLERAPAAGYNVKQFDIPMLLEASDRYGLRTRLQAALSKSEVLDVAEHAVSFVSRQMGGEVVGWTKEVTETLGIKPLGWQLSTMAKAFGYQPSGIAHEAAEDVTATAYLRDVLADEGKAKSLFNRDVLLQSIKETTGRELPLYKDISNVVNVPGLQPEEYYTKPFYEHIGTTPVAEARAKTLLEIEQLVPKKAMAAPVIEKAPFLQSSLKGKSILGMALAVGAFGLINNRISGRDDYYNTIEAFGHGNMAEFQRRSLTDFGSGYQGLNFGPYAGILQTSWVPASSLGKSQEEVFHTLVTPKEDREPAYQDASSMMGSAAAVGTALHSLESARMFSRGYAKDVEKTLFDPNMKVSGRADIILQSDEPLDIKSVDLENLQNIMNTGARAKDVSQLNWYMSQMGAERGYLKYEAREDPSQFVWMEVPFSEKLLNIDLAKVRKARMKMLRGLERGTIDISQIQRSSTLEELTEKAMTTERLRPIPELEEEFTRQQELMFEIQRRRVTAYEQPQYSQQFSGHNSQYNTIKGFGETGLSLDMRHTYTDFGSGLVEFFKRITGNIARSFKGIGNKFVFSQGDQISKEFLSAVKQSRTAGIGLFESIKQFGEKKGIKFLEPEEFAEEFVSGFASTKSPDWISQVRSGALEKARVGVSMPSRGLISIGSSSEIIKKAQDISVKTGIKFKEPEKMQRSLVAMHEILETLHTQKASIKKPQFGSHLSPKIIEEEAFLSKAFDKELFKYAKAFRETEIQSAVGYKETVAKIYQNAPWQTRKRLLLNKIVGIHPGSENSLGAKVLKDNSDFGSSLVEFVKRISLGIAQKFSRVTNKAVRPIGKQSIDDLKVPIQQQLSAFESFIGSKDPLSLTEAKFASPEQLQKSFEWSDLVATKIAEKNRFMDEEVAEVYKRYGKIPSWIPEQQAKTYKNRAEIATKNYIRNKQERLVEELNYQRNEVSRLMAGKPKIELLSEAKEFLEQRKRLEPYVENKYMPYFEKEFRRRAAPRFGVLQSEINRLEGVAFELENKITPSIMPPRLEKVVSTQQVVDPTRTADLGAAAKRNKRFAKLAESAHGLGLKAEHNASKGHSKVHSNTTRID